jgi:hypothetical protein
MRNRLFAVAAGIVGVLIASTVAAPEAAADTALSTPGTPVATQLTTTSIAISWTASSGPVANYTVQVIDERLGVFHDIGTPAGTTFTHSGLNPDSVYEYRVVANPVAGSGYAASTASGVLYTRTAPLPDSVPPTRPGTPFAYTVSTTRATIVSGSGSTDNHRVAGYVVQQQLNGVWTDLATNDNTTVYVTGLTPNTTYSLAMVAFDANGNRSPRSDPVTFTTRQLASQPACTVSIVTFGQSYSLNVTVENMTTQPVSNWTVTFTLPAAHTVNYVFIVTLARNGSTATATPLFYVTTLSPGTSITFGVNANYPAGSPLPGTFVLNGNIPCTT